jgi:hypothetical protein
MPDVGGQGGQLPTHIWADLESKPVPLNDLLLLLAFQDFQTFRHLWTLSTKAKLF